ncbi:hypothetical protein F5Y19DRAFT_16142 [Xylariaceae sp. FL1651]|nr:hypothetical protein F5Y19DRAFT_16142 [Xylariaceae sp. FL1651]
MASIRDLLIPDEVAVKSAGKENSTTDPDATFSETKYFVIEFIHDTICPFCYIGLKTLLAAIDIYKIKHPDAVFEVTCTPFILAPTALTSSYNKLHYYAGYRGLPASRFPLWEELGKAVGINFSWKGRTGNTRNSHKLLRFALQKTPTLQRSTSLTRYGPGAGPPLYPPYSLRAPDLLVACEQPRGPDLQLRLLDAITKQYHEYDSDLSDPQFLTETTIAVTGFKPSEIQAVLDSEEWDRTIDSLSHEVQNRLEVRNPGAGPIVAVPTMVLNNRWVYGGFLHVNELVQQFEMLRQGIAPSQVYTSSTMIPVPGTADSAARSAAMVSGSGSGLPAKGSGTNGI